jgi:hypothetical protein
VAARVEVRGRGRIEVFAGFRTRLTAYGKAVLVTSLASEETEMCSVAELCEMCQLATRAVSVSFCFCFVLFLFCLFCFV